MSRVLATSSELFHHIKIQIQKLSTAYPGLSDKSVIRQHSIFGRIGDQW